jgi:hypothetical protein
MGYQSSYQKVKLECWTVTLPNQQETVQEANHRHFLAVAVTVAGYHLK